MKTIAQQLGVKEFPFEIKDKWGNIIYHEKSNRWWSKSEYDKLGNEIYFENSNGYIEDRRPNTIELTLDEIAQKFNIPVEQLKIKK